MPQIQPSISKQELLCAETPAAPCGMVVFGGSGDLARRKLIPSLYEILVEKKLTDDVAILVVGRRNLTDAEYRDIVGESLVSAGISGESADRWCGGRLHYQGVGGDEGYAGLAKRLK